MEKPARLLFICVTGCTRLTSSGAPEASLAPSSITAAPPPPSSPSPPRPQPTNAPGPFFPPNTFPRPVAQLVSDGYGKQLVAMNEPSLWAAAARGETAYRFLWLRTWGRPIAVRVTFDGSRARLFATRMTGDGGYDPGTVDVHRERALPAAELGRVDAAFAEAHFDAIETEGPTGMDGASWVLERAKDGVYRIVERWTPRHKPEYAAFVRACDLFLDLAGRDLVTGEVY